jgi:hypothetical protein
MHAARAGYLPGTAEHTPPREKENPVFLGRKIRAADTRRISPIGAGRGRGPRAVFAVVPMASSRTTTPSPSGRSPFAGCFIFIAAGLVMVFLISFSTYVLFRQYAEIERFTEASPAPRPIPSIEQHEAETHQLARTIEVFRQQLGGDSPATLRLSPAEINLAIAAFAPLEELRGTFEVLAIGDDHLEIAISFPLNGKPRLTREGESGWITSDNRYLNATLIARPALLQREVVLEILEIRPTSGAEVPAEFIGLMSPYRISERYLTDPAIGPAMASLTRVELEEGALVFIREPGVAPKDSITDAQVDSGARRFFLFFGIGATVFLAFAGAVVFFGIRRAKKTDISP